MRKPPVVRHDPRILQLLKAQRDNWADEMKRMPVTDSRYLNAPATLKQYESQVKAMESQLDAEAGR